MQKFRKSFSLRFYKRGAPCAEPAAPSCSLPPASSPPEREDCEEECEDCEQAGGSQGRRADRPDDRGDGAAGEDDDMEGGLR